MWHSVCNRNFEPSPRARPTHHLHYCKGPGMTRLWLSECLCVDGRDRAHIPEPRPQQSPRPQVLSFPGLHMPDRPCQRPSPQFGLRVVILPQACRPWRRPLLPVGWRLGPCQDKGWGWGRTCPWNSGYSHFPGELAARYFCCTSKENFTF